MKQALILSLFLMLIAFGTVSVILLYPEHHERNSDEIDDPKTVRQWRELAVQLYRSRNYRDAELMFKRILKVSPADFFSRRALGKIYLETERDADADELFRALLIARPFDTVSRNNLGVALVRQNKIEAGIRELQIAHRLGAGTAYISANLADAYRRLGDSEKSGLYWQQLQIALGDETLSRPPPFDAATVPMGQWSDPPYLIPSEASI